MQNVYSELPPLTQNKHKHYKNSLEIQNSLLQTLICWGKYEKDPTGDDKCQSCLGVSYWKAVLCCSGEPHISSHQHMLWLPIIRQTAYQSQGEVCFSSLQPLTHSFSICCSQTAEGFCLLAAFNFFPVNFKG